MICPGGDLSNFNTGTILATLRSVGSSESFQLLLKIFSKLSRATMFRQWICLHVIPLEPGDDLLFLHFTATLSSSRVKSKSSAPAGKPAASTTVLLVTSSGSRYD